MESDEKKSMTLAPVKTSKMTYQLQYPEYFEAIYKAIVEWDTAFSNYDFNDYLYTEQENIVYGILEKLYTRIRMYKNTIPKEIKMKLPTLKQLDEDMMYEDSDMHLSDYEYFITDILRKTYEKGSKKIKVKASSPPRS